MTDIKIFDHLRLPEDMLKKEILEFLKDNLQEYGDPKEDILKAINYSLSSSEAAGGFILTARFEGELAGVVVVNKTGMEGYIPENVLVYIATRKDLRGKGIGKALMEKAVEESKGSIALHVEPDNPARYLYEKIGFTSKYIEMRYYK